MSVSGPLYHYDCNEPKIYSCSQCLKHSVNPFAIASNDTERKNFCSGKCFHKYAEMRLESLEKEEKTKKIGTSVFKKEDIRKISDSKNS